MANIRYQSNLQIVNYLKNAKLNDKPEVFHVPVHSFEVDGGTERRIDLTSSDELTIGSEFEQARTYTNFVFYILPTKDFMAVRLMNIAQTNGKHFNLTFNVSVIADGKVIRKLNLESYAARFLEAPLYVAGEPPLLKARVRLQYIRLEHGQSNGQDNSITYKQI